MAPQRYIWSVYAGLLCLVAGLCFGDLRTHLLDTHDAETFRDHLRIQQDWTFFFSSDKEQSSGRPFAEAVKYAAFLFFGNNPAAFHLLVVALHTLAAWLLARVVCLQVGQPIIAGLTGLLFLANVTHFQAVHHISALDYPLALCCGLFGLLALGRDGAIERPAVFAATLVLGLWSHPSIAAVWPLALYLVLQRDSSLRRVLNTFWPSELLLAIAFFGGTQWASKHTSTWQSFGEFGAQPPLEVFAGMIRSPWWFCSRLLTTAHWLPIQVYTQHTWELGLGAALVGLLLWLVWRRREPLAAAALAILLGLLPFLLLTESTILGLPAGPSRYLYMASAGSSLLLAWGLDWTYRRAHPFLAIGLLILTLAASYHSLGQVEAISFYTSGRSYSASNEYDYARQHFRRALETASEVVPTPDIYIRYCLLQMNSGEDYIPLLTKALADHPYNPQLRTYELATAAVDSSAELREQAMQLALESRYINPHDAETTAKALHNLGTGFRNTAHPARAILAYEQALRIQPNRFKTLKDLAFAHWQLAAHLADRIDLQNWTDQTKLVTHLHRQLEAANEIGEQALQRRPDADLYFQIGRVHQQYGRHDKALAAYRRALTQDRNYRRAHQGMAEIFAIQGEHSAAARALRSAADLTTPRSQP